MAKTHQPMLAGSAKHQNIGIPYPNTCSNQPFFLLLPKYLEDMKFEAPLAEIEVLTVNITDQQYGLPISGVVRVIRAAAVFGIPDRGSLLHGLINIHGEIVPVFNSRKYFGLPEKEIDAEDFFVLINTPVRKVILVVDGIGDILKIESRDLCSLGIVLEDGTYNLTERSCFENASILKTHTGMLLILEADHLLSGAMNTEIGLLLAAKNQTETN